jgi:tetratricopeptide (TPR) repeat protein
MLLAAFFWCALPAHAKTPPAAGAATDDDDAAAARKYYQRGVAHYNLTEYREAIVEFEAAYRLRPDPVFLYNLAQSYRLSNQPELALQFYKTYLRAESRAANRREVENRIADLERLLQAKQHIQRPPDTTLSPGERKAGEPEVAEKTAPVLIAQPKVNVLNKEPPPTPVYKKWWLWTVVGVAAAGVAVGVGVGVTQGAHYPNSYPTLAFGGAP